MSEEAAAAAAATTAATATQGESTGATSGGYTALVLSSINDGVVCPSTALLRPDAVTVEFWAYTETLKRNPVFVLLTSDEWDCGYGVIGKKPGEFLVFHSGHVDDPDVEHATSGVEARKWTHFCGTCDGRKLKFYVNGVLAVKSRVAAATAAEKAGGIDYGAAPERLALTIGHKLWGRSKFGFVGMVADVRVWSVAKTEGEILTLMQGLPLDARARRGLVLHYAFDPGHGRASIDGAGSVVRDLSGHGHDGVLVGGARCVRVTPPPNAPFVPAGSLRACCLATITAAQRKSAKKAARTRTRTHAGSSDGSPSKTGGLGGSSSSSSSGSGVAGSTATARTQQTFSPMRTSLSFLGSSSSSSGGGGGGAGGLGGSSDGAGGAKALFRPYQVVRDERLPRDGVVKLSVDALTFRLSAPAKLDTTYEETFRIANQGVSRVTVELPKELRSHRYVLTFEPALVSVRAGTASDVRAQITFLCTTVVADELYLGVYQDYAKKTGGGSGLFGSRRVRDEEVLPDSVQPLRVCAESELTTRLDYMELVHDERPIGEGSFGVVYRGEWRGTPVAIKQLKVQFLKKQELDEFHREVSIMERLRSPYVVNMVGAVLTENHLAIVTEFMSHGSVKHAFGKKKFKTPTVKFRVALDAAHGLDFLHKNNIIHRDVKNDNLLIVSLSHRAPVTVKLTDFGTSRSDSMAIRIEMTKGIGTPAFMAPEILDSKPYSKPADVYSFGVSMYELWTEKTPYTNCGFTKPWDVAHFVISGKRLPVPRDMPAAYAAIMQACWAHDPARRPTFAQVVEMLQEALDSARS